MPSPHTDRRDPDVAGFPHGRVPRDVRITQLLDLAEDIFLDRGYEGFSIEALCKAARVSRPVVYDNLGSKDAIFIACIRRFQNAYESAIGAVALRSEVPIDVIEAGADAFFSALEQSPKAWSLLYSAPAIAGPVAREVENLRTTSVHHITTLGRALLPDSVDAERISAMARFISGAGEELGRWWLRNPHIPRQRVVEYHRDFINAIVTAENTTPFLPADSIREDMR